MREVVFQNGGLNFKLGVPHGGALVLMGGWLKKNWRMRGGHPSPHATPTPPPPPHPTHTHTHTHIYYGKPCIWRGTLSILMIKFKHYNFEML